VATSLTSSSRLRRFRLTSASKAASTSTTSSSARSTLTSSGEKDSCAVPKQRRSQSLRFGCQRPRDSPSPNELSFYHIPAEKRRLLFSAHNETATFRPRRASQEGAPRGKGARSSERRKA